MKEYKNMGEHVQDLAAGQMVGIGEVIRLSAEEEKEPYNARLIESGTLVEIPSEEKKAPPKKSSSKAKEGDEA